MPVVITDIGKLANEHSTKTTDDPSEFTEYKHAVAHSVATAEIDGWSIAGDVPSNLSIDDKGVISGTIEGFWKQSSTLAKALRQDEKFVEYDNRNFPDNLGRFTEKSFVFNFVTTVNWREQDSNGAYTIPMLLSVPHMIELVRDHDADIIRLMTNYLDGADNRLPFHCDFSGVSTKDQCEIIGGTWENDKCNIYTPKNETDCKNVGGTWENDKCNLMLIQKEQQCLNIGGTWVKNSFTTRDKDDNPIILDNSADWLSNQYKDKVAKFTGILTPVVIEPEEGEE